MPAYLIVRAQVPEDELTAFDRWYQDEHLPDAMAAFGASHAERGWSADDPRVHIALYTFPNITTAETVLASAATANLIAEFDRVWQGRVTRTREVVSVRQSMGEGR
ncbi:MAG: hypothetical protein AAGH74_08255 [Pseudomonadota bacterium]